MSKNHYAKSWHIDRLVMFIPAHKPTACLSYAAGNTEIF